MMEKPAMTRSQCAQVDHLICEDMKQIEEKCMQAMNKLQEYSISMEFLGKLQAKLEDLQEEEKSPSRKKPENEWRKRGKLF